jgi:3-oxoacyl-[acyl-carrier-protein] synthase II
MGVVVTGMGVVSPLGGGLEATLAGLMAGRVVRAPVQLFDTEGCRCREAAACAEDVLARRPRQPRAVRLGLPALREALEGAGLLGPGGRVAARYTGMPCCLSTTGGAMELGERFLAGALRGAHHHALAQVTRYQPHQQVREFQRGFGLHGPSWIVANACASGANAIGHAFDLVSSGRADCVLAGGFEALTDLIFTGFDCLQSLSTTTCRPFDAGRDGLMLGEGAAFMVLESAAHAQARGAAVLGRVLGYGHATDLHHLTQPHPAGGALAASIDQAVRRAGVGPEAIGYINAHGTGTPMNDPAECAGYRAACGGRLDGAMVSSVKSAIGHTLGAAGVIEAVATLAARSAGGLPPQTATVEAIEGMAGRLPVPGTAWPADRPLALSVNLGFGGSNAALVLAGGEG